MNKLHKVLIALGALLSFPMAALAQNAPGPANPSFSTSSKFTYARVTKGLWLDSALQLGTGPYLGSSTIYGTIDTTPSLGQNTAYLLNDPGAGTANVLTDSDPVSAITIQHISVPLTSTQILAMYATPVQLIAAPTGTQSIVVHHALFTMTATSTAYTGGTNVEIQVGNTNHGGGTATTAAIAASVVDAGTAGTTYTTVIPVSYTYTTQTGLFISVTGSTFATGTGTAVVDVWYSLK